MLNRYRTISGSRLLLTSVLLVGLGAFLFAPPTWSQANVQGQSTGPATVDFGSGFTMAGLQFNGHTKLDGTRLLLTDTTSTNQVASAFWTVPVNVHEYHASI